MESSRTLIQAGTIPWKLKGGGISATPYHYYLVLKKEKGM
jgi:hypothetical protein